MMSVILNEQTRMRYDTEHKQKTREKVLNAAAKAIRKQGPYRLGVAGVMKGAGLTHGGFYAHFASKDELIAEAIGQMFDQGRARFLAEVRDYPPPKALSAYIDFYLSSAHRDTRTSGCPMPVLAADLPRLDRAARARFSAGVASLTNGLASRISEMGLPDPEALSRSIVAELVGALSLARAEPDIARSDAMLADSRALLKQRLGIGQHNRNEPGLRAPGDKGAAE